jgi:hypothetical protein
MQPDLRETSWSHGAVARAVPKRRRTWRRLMVGGLLAGSVSLFAVAAPAYAINEPQGAGQRVLGRQLGVRGRPSGPGEPGHQLPHAAGVAVCVGQ